MGQEYFCDDCGESSNIRDVVILTPHKGRCKALCTNCLGAFIAYHSYSYSDPDMRFIPTNAMTRDDWHDDKVVVLHTMS